MAAIAMLIYAGIGQEITIFDMMRDTKSDEYNGSSLAGYKSISTTVIKPGEAVAADSVTAQVRLTGVAGDKVVLRIGDKRRILDCESELFNQIEDLFPAQGTATIESGKLIEFTPDAEV